MTPTLSPAVHSAMLSMLHCCTSDLKRRFIKREQVQHLTAEEIQTIAEAVAKAMENKVAQKEVQKVYRELERDPSIKGVGATQKPGARPPNIVPRQEFLSRGGLTQITEEAGQIPTRSRTEPTRVTLISPMLIPGTRRWRFLSQNIEFTAPIQDEVFVDNLLTGRRPIPMTAGIEMDVLLQTDEEKKDGVWVVTDRMVLHVIHTHLPPLQGDLNLPSTTEIERSNKPKNKKTKRPRR